MKDRVEKKQDESVAISLRVTHPKWTAQEIIDVLGAGLVPVFQWSQGDKKVTPKGERLVGVHSESYVCFELCTGKARVGDALRDCNATLAPRSGAIKRLHSSGGTLEYFIGWYLARNTGDTIGVDELTTMADLGIALTLDLYP